MKRILILEPYFGGSHKYFLEGLRIHVPADYTFLVLPARRWKMRMQLSAPWFVEQVSSMPIKDRAFDLVLCSSFVDVAVFRSMVSLLENWNRGVKFLTYFHENQFAYPLQFHNKPEYQFSAINFNSALCSDGIGFNSKYNRDTFLNGCSSYLKRATDMKIQVLVQSLRGKSVILFPAIDFSHMDNAVKLFSPRPIDHIPVIVWNHRWEHDKNPELFFSALKYLEEKGLDFRLIVLGQSFPDSPTCFSTAQVRFAGKILHFGFVKSYKRYIDLLSQGDIVVSTARHEFFGISVIEAVRAGCIPVLPDDLSYQELFNKRFLYGRNKLFEHLAGVVERCPVMARDNCKVMTELFSWYKMKEKYGKWFNQYMC